MRPVIHCRMCLRKVNPVLELTPTPIANAFADRPDQFAMRYPLGLSECPGCGHVQIGHHIDGAVLFEDYKYQTPQAERTRLAEYAKKLAEKYPDALRNSTTTKTVGRDKCNVLEIGSNNGIFVDELNKAGFWAVGVDPSPNAPKTGMPKWFTSKTARQIEYSMGRMKLILANNVLAHVDDLRNVLLGVKYLLADDGHLIFEVQYLPDLVAGAKFDMIYHEHKDYHQLKTWPYLLAKFGMVVKEYEFIPTHGGSVRVTVGFGENGIAVPNEVIDWKVFKDRIEEAKRGLLQDMENKEGRLVAFGATAKACTLIHHFGIADQIAYCVDETPDKQGKYIPGTTIEISGPERLKKEPPDVVILTAWNYAEILRPRFQCEVIVPFKRAA